MSVARTLVGNRLKRRWTNVVAVVLLGGIGFGLVGTGISLARRTDSSIDRIATATDAVHVDWSHNLSAAEVDERLGAVDGRVVLDGRGGTLRHWIGFADVSGALGGEFDLLGPFNSTTTLEELDIERGRRPTAANELFLSGVASGRIGLDVGDQLDLQLLRSDFSGAEPHSFVVAGVGTLATETGLRDRVTVTPSAVFSERFANAHEDLRVWSASGIRLDGGSLSRAQASALLEPAGFAPTNVLAEKVQQVRTAVRPAVTGLAVAAALTAVASILIVGFALARESEGWDDERSALRAMGMSRRSTRRLDTLLLLVPTTGAVAIGAVVMIGLSPLGPVGDLRRFDPESGIVIEPFGLVAIAVAGLASALVARGLARVSDSAVPREEPATRWLPFALLTGAGHQSRRSLAIGLGLATIATAAAAGTLPFHTSMRALVDEPDRYGQAWQLVARNRFGDQDPAAVEELARDERADAVATVTLGSVNVNGRFTVPTAAYDVIAGSDRLSLVDGDRPAGPTEALIGQRTLDELDIELGDRVRLLDAGSSVFAQTRPEGVTAEVTVTGTAVFPSMGSPGAPSPRLDVGLAISPSVWEILIGEQDAPEVTLVSLHDSVNAAEFVTDHPVVADLSPQTNGTEWFIDPAPREIESVDEVTTWTVAGLVTLSIVVSLVFALALRSVIRRQRNELAVLRALGATKGEVGRIVLRQGLIATLPVLAIGIPLGIGVGRLLAARTIERIGAIADPTTPAWALAVLVVGLTLLAGIAVLTSTRYTPWDGHRLNREV